ncbi:MAG: TolC family protein [Deltaproteobacteria bacterium]|nr:TolC family protein [Deltaproteobacteria bacterium]
MYNPSLEAAKERVHQARQKLSQARSAYWPRLDLTHSASHAYLSDNDYQNSLETARRTNPFAEIDDEVETYQAGLRLTWTLFNGFERKFSNLSTRYGERHSMEAGSDTRRLLLSYVAASFYNALLARENISIAEANMAFNQRQLKEAIARHRAGTGSLSDVLNFEVRIHSAETELLKARRTYEITKIGLAAFMGIPDTVLPPQMELALLEKETPEELVLPDQQALIQYALENRPDILQMNYILRQAEANVGIARAGFYPTVALSASIDGDRIADRRFEREDFGETVMMSFSFNLFAGGYNRAKVREAEAIYREAERNLENVKISARSDAVSSFFELKSAQEQLVLERKNADLVKQNRDLVEKEYIAGQTSLVRLNEAQRDLTTAQSRLVSALVSMRLSWENLKASTGEILILFQDI